MLRVTICIYLIVEIIPSPLHIRGGSESSLSSLEGEKLSGYQDMRQWYHGTVDDGTNVGNRKLDGSDDFYLDSAVDNTPVPTITTEITDPGLKVDKVYYEAVDYESASSTYIIPQQYRKKSKKKSKASFMKVFSVFAWKGFGLSVEKSVIQWNAFGAGLSVPVTSNFPEWERNTALPKLSTTFGLNYPYGCKMSLSVSIPLNNALLGMMTVVKLVSGITPSATYAKWMDKLKKQKATESVKRVGITATIKYNEAKGLFMYVGPWVFYYPGLEVMQYLLPMIFSFPAILITILGLFLQLDSMNLKDTTEGKIGSNKIAPMNTLKTVISPINNLYSTIKIMIFGDPDTINPNISTNLIIPNDPPNDRSLQFNPPSIPGKIQPPSLSIENKEDIRVFNKTKQTLKSQKKKSTLISGDINPQKVNNSSITNKDKIKTWKKPKGFFYWHKRILLWASNKKTGLGYNMKWNYKSLTDVHDASLGSRVVFDISTFKPFPKTLSKLYKAYTSSPKNTSTSKKAMKDIGVHEPMNLKSINDFISRKSEIHTLTQNQRDILENALLLDEEFNDVKST